MSASSWQDKAIYFILIDRFFNGDRTIDDFGKGEHDPSNDDCFQGGDLQGVIDKLPHIKALGFDAVWITPPVYNQWINPYIATRGFHGYWAYDFTAIDPHFGTLELYKRLVQEAHSLGLKVIQDIVVNHTGNFFTVDGKDYDVKRPELNWREAGGAFPPEDGPKAPRDPVFRMNNPNVREHKDAAVYNFTPNISDFKSREQTLTYAMGDLDDINVRSPLAANRLKEIYRFWIEAVGIDGFRVDTVYYTPEDFYEDFLFSRDPANLGVKRFAQKRGDKEFFVFGEVWCYDYRAINRYIKEGKTARLDSAIDLPLNEALGQVFYRKTATEKLRKPLEAKRRNANLWVNFLDNHDVERMASRAGWPSVQQSLVALFTLPGLPCVTYGTEAGFTATRQNMFREECFDLGSKQAVFLKALLAFRKRHPALARGRCRVERASLACGVLAYTVSHGEQAYTVVFNTASDRMILPLPRAAGGFEVLLSSAGELKILDDAVLLPPGAYLVLKRLRAACAPAPRALSLRPLRRGLQRGDIEIGYDLPAAERVQELFLLCDDNYDSRVAVENIGSGVFRLDAAQLGNGRHTLSLLALTRSGSHHFSNESQVVVRNPYRLLAKAVVPRENKGGVTRKVHAPAEPSYDGQLSLEAVEAFSSGRDLRLRLRMANVTAGWNPPNGYDHVYFSVFFDFPGRPGGRRFPKMDYERDDFEFNCGFLLHGWGARSFGAEDSTAQAYGAPLVGDIEQAVDLKHKTVTFTFSSRFFDGLKSLSGVRVFISTWDGYLGDFRGVSEKREDWSFYTLDGAAAGLPKVFDRLLLKL